MDSLLFNQFKAAVTNLKRDLHKAVTLKDFSETRAYITSVAKHIAELDKAARMAQEIEELRESATAVDFVLTTPWGAPFVGHSTLLDAARGFQRSKKVACELTNLVKAFREYEKHYHSQVLTLLEDVEKELMNEKI